MILLKRVTEFFRLGNFQLFYIFLTLLIITFLVYFLVLPSILPSLHHSSGMLKGGDWIQFHEKSVALAALIRSEGWSAWTLLPERQAPIGLSSFLYVATGINHPIVPAIVQVAVYAIGLFFAHKFLQAFVSNRFSIFGLLIMIFMPSSAMIYTQIHKDPYTVSAFFIFMFGFLQIYRNIFAALILMICSFLLLAVFRFYLLEIYAVLATFCLAGLVILGREKKFWKITSVIASLWVFIYSAEQLVQGEGRYTQELNLVTEAVDAYSYILRAPDGNNGLALPSNSIDGQNPMHVDSLKSMEFFFHVLERNILNRLNSVRKGFISGHPNAGTNIDVDVRFNSIYDIVGYVPRALQIGLFAPLPSIWVNDGYTLNSSAYRLIGAIESSVFYVGCAILCFVGWKRRKHLSNANLTVIAALVFCILYCLVIGLTIPNQGALIRMRMAPWLLLNGAVWSLVIAHFTAHFSRTR